ncbi:DNA-directed RNA polymerase subunit H [Candidatus Woesearchaeota archaeon]|nr:DNA-directed RNA polymerase subunit H [Candidatus Woesearchaeota archaeon]
MNKKIDVKKHILVPKYQKLSDKEKEELLQKYNVTTSELPRILKSDPMLAGVGAKPGDVMQITRNSSTAGRNVFYRVVVNG